MYYNHLLMMEAKAATSWTLLIVPFGSITQEETPR